MRAGDSNEHIVRDPKTYFNLSPRFPAYVRECMCVLT